MFVFFKDPDDTKQKPELRHIMYWLMVTVHSENNVALP